MELIDRLDEFKLSDKNNFLLEDAVTNYQEYINNLSTLSLKELKGYLKALAHAEVRSNQNFDEKNFLFIEACENINKNNSSVHKMIDLFKNKDSITSDDVIDIHTILMKGIDDDIAGGYRDNDNKFVGSFNSDGTKRVDYMPIPCADINKDMELALAYLNSDNKDNPFIVPFVFHCLISVMQPFDDGNTRTARLFQHGKIWTNTNNIYNCNFDNPIFYLSSTYYRYGNQYRELMSDVANNKDIDAWNRWITFNLNLTNEQLYNYDVTLKRLRKY